MATIRINGTDFHMSDRSLELVREGAVLAEIKRLEGRARELAQSPTTRNGAEIHAVCNELARLRLAGAVA